jgi:uncharacterized protein (DUF1501 family)
MRRDPTWLTRRRFLQGLGLGAASLGLPVGLRSLPAIAGIGEPSDDGSPFLVVCDFAGGWDQLQIFDPRSDLDYTEANGSTILPDYAALAGTSSDSLGGFAAFMGSNPSGITTVGEITLGPAARYLAPWADRFSLVRGINMGTLTHQVGARYFLTGKFPSGLAAKGSALPTWLTSEVGAQLGSTNLPPIPNLAIGVETYNDGLPGYASGLQVSNSQDLRGVLYSFDPTLSDVEADAIDAYFDGASMAECTHGLYNGGGDVDTFLQSREAAKILAGGELETYFNFALDNTTNADLYEHFGLNELSNAQASQAARGGIGQAMIAAQAITRGVSQCVGVTLANGIDHHDEDYGSDHYEGLATGMLSLERLISYLDVHGVLDRTTILVTSEFARTPKRNARGGRDHHLSSSCMVMGPGIVQGQVLGATDDETWVFQTVDPQTGALDSAGHAIRPTDIHATLLDSMGQSYDHLSNQDPVVLEVLKKT